jgi:DNA-binding MarR family transcriptional regulator
LAQQPQSLLDAKIVAALERLAHALNRVLWDAAWQHGLSPTQAQVVLYLLAQTEQQVTLGELARRFDLTHATLSDAVRALVSKGWVRRSRHPHDARSALLRLSHKGRRLARSLARWADLVRQQVAGLPDADKGPLLAVLLDLIGRLHQAGLISVARTCSTCLFFQAQRYADPEAPHHCRLLDRPLRLVELQVECPDHQPRSA